MQPRRQFCTSSAAFSGSYTIQNSHRVDVDRHRVGRERLLGGEARRDDALIDDPHDRVDERHDPEQARPAQAREPAEPQDDRALPLLRDAAAQTALRDIIGRTSLTDLLRGRERIEEELQRLIDERSTPWGVTVQAVEMRDVVIPQQLQDAMSREAQADREKRARIILGQAEMEIAHSFETASRVYESNPTALHLRAMNMLYEGLKEKGALMLVPTTMVESMGMGSMLGAAALQQAGLAGREEIK